MSSWQDIYNASISKDQKKRTWQDIYNDETAVLPITEASPVKTDIPKDSVSKQTENYNRLMGMANPVERKGFSTSDIRALRTQMPMGGVVNNVGNALANSREQNLVTGLKSMGATDEEVKTIQRDKTQYENILPSLNERVAQQRQEVYKQRAEENPVFESAISVPANLIGGAMGAVDLAAQKAKSALTGKPVDFNTDFIAMSDMANATRGTVAQNIENPVGRFLYQTGMSMADSAAMVGLSAMGIPGASGFLGMSAAVSSAKEAKERGLSDNRALAIGALAGAAEALFEKFSIDRLLSLKNPATAKAWLGNVLKQGATEASEETATSIANEIVDRIIAGDKSNYNLNVERYMLNGMSEEEAKKAAGVDLAKQIGLDALGGFVSGGVFGAGSNIVSNRLARSAENQPVSEANATEEITPVVAETTAKEEIKPTTTNLDAKTIEAIEKDEISRNIMVGLYGEEWQNKASETIGQGTLEKAKEMRDMRNSLDEAARRSESTRLVDAMKKRGINVETKAFAGEDSGRVGYYDVANDRIVLNERAKADEVFKFVTAHEISHSVENTDAYSSLRSLAEKSYTPEGLEQAIRKTQEEYRREAGQELDREGALKEITADYLANILKDSKRLEQIVYDDRNLAERLLDAIKKFLSDVSDSFKGIDRTELENAERILERALTEKTGTDSRGRSVETKKASTTGEGIQHSVVKIGGKNVVKLDGNIFVDENGNSLSETQAYNKLVGREITFPDGDTITFVKYLPPKKRMSRELLRRKPKYNSSVSDIDSLNDSINKNIFEIIEASEMKDPSQPDIGRRHAQNGIVAFDTREVTIADDNNAYDLTLSIAILKNGKKIAYAKKFVKTNPEVWAEIKKKNETGVKSPNTRSSGTIIDETSAKSQEENFEKSKNSAKDMEDVGVEVDKKSESVYSTQFSLKTWEESDYVKTRDAAAKDLAEAIGITEEKARQYIDDVNTVAAVIASDKERLDYIAAEGLSAFVSNAEYGGSFDFTTLCKKRRWLTGTFSAIQKALPDTALTAEEVLDIRNRMREKGYEVSCGLCYVEGSRANMGKFAKEFIRLYKEKYPDRWIPDMYDVNTPDGVEAMRIEHPEAYEQYEYFWNHYGKLDKEGKNLFASQQKPKLYQARSEYAGEILELFQGNKDKIADKNRFGGIRFSSFSDFEVVHLLDMMQAITDMSRVGLAGQAYTKVPEFAEAMGRTGLKINLSLIAKDVVDGKLVFDNVEGMHINDAMKLRNKFSDNVGTIVVVFTDDQLNAAMADERIDFIIPYHRSQWKKNQYGLMGLPKKVKDFTYQQNEKLLKPTYHEYQGRMVKDKATNFMPNKYWDFNKTGKENAEDYLKLCAEENKRPKFYKLLVDNKDGSYSLQPDGSTDGYWKLLIDFKMYNNEGKGVKQMPVKPEFNIDGEGLSLKKMLNEYEGGHQAFPVAKDVVDEFLQERKKGKISIVDMADRANKVYAGENENIDVKKLARQYSLTKRDEADIEKIIDELAKEFGIMRPGANRTTDVKTPKATGQGNVRRFAQSVMESQHSDDEIRTLVKEGIIDNVLTYKVEGDQAALDYANNELEKLGYERAMGAWENAISGDKALSKNEIVFGERLLVEAAKNQNYEDVLKLTAQIAVEGTRAGQMVQALSMLKRMGPEGQLVTLQRYVEKTNKDFAQEAKKKAAKNKGDILRKEQELRKEREKAKGQEEALKKSMEEAKKSASEMKKSLSKTLSGNKSLEKRIAKVQERITELEGKIADSKEINEELKERLAELREERNKLYKLANSYKNKNATKERQIFDKANQILDLEKILTRQVKMYETQKAALENLSMTAKAMKELERGIANLKGEIVISEETVKDIMSQTTQKGLDEAMERAYKEVAAQVPATLLDKWNAWRYMAMLTNPTTHIRNVFGNATFMPARALKNAAKVYLEEKLDAKEKTAAHLGKDSEDYLKLAGEAFEENKNFLKSGGKYNPSNVIMDNRRIFDTKWLEDIRKGNSNLMEAEDMIFLKKAYVEAYARYLKANNFLESSDQNSLKQKANDWATREALRATYRDASEFANMLSKYEREHKFGGFIVNAFVPFKKTPINIAKRGFEYSPAGLIKGIWEMTSGVKSGSVSAAVALDDLASGLSGTAIMALGMLLAHMDLLTGSGDDDKEKNAYDKAVGGFQPYSLSLGDTTYTLNWAAPTALPMFTGVELYNLIAKEGLSFGEMLGSLFKVLDPMAEMSMLSSLTDIIRSAGYATDSASMISNMAMETVTSYLGQAVPTLGRRIAGIADDTQRNVYYRDETKGMPTSFVIFGNEVKNKIPLISKTIEPKIDVWGRTIQDGTTERILENLVSPGYFSKKKITPVDEEIMRVYENTADASVIPDTSPGRTYSKNGENISMSATEFTTYRQIAGQMQYNNINSLIKTSWYKKLTDEEKAEAISEMYSYANYFGKKQVFGESYTSESLLKKYKASLNSKVPYSDIYRYDKEIDELTKNRGDKAAWEVVVSYLDKQPLNKVQKMYLFPLFSTKEKNPYA